MREHINKLKGYMPEESARGLAEIFQRLQGTVHSSNDKTLVILNVLPVNMYELFWNEGWIKDVPFPKEDDWAVMAEYDVIQTNWDGTITSLLQTSDCVPVSFLADVLSVYNVALNRTHKQLLF